ncbi:MAG: hypothetical protein Q7T44_13960 [Parvibaculum sp.]|nr:hypothetical protein [Parvibaculum sp.]
MAKKINELSQLFPKSRIREVSTANREFSFDIRVISVTSQIASGEADVVLFYGTIAEPFRSANLAIDAAGFVTNSNTQSDDWASMNS